jgi:alpha-1,2-glucosyltransferase
MATAHAPLHGTPTPVSARFALLALACGTFALLVIGHWAFLRSPLWIDEPVHYDQIIAIFSGDGAHNPYLTTFATYHWLVAGAMTLLGNDTVSTARAVSALAGLSLVGLAAVLYAKRVHGSWSIAAHRAALIVLMPVLLPYFFVIYTDPLGLAFVLFAGCAAESRRWWLAALLVAAAVAIRQVNVMWALWLIALAIARDGQSLLAWPAWRARALALAPLGVVVLAFATFVVVNGGVALGHSAWHPPGMHAENPFFALFVAFLVLLPLHVAAAPHVLELWRRHRVLIPLFAATVGLWFVIGFNADHPFNRPPTHLHNQLLLWLNQLDSRLLMVLPVVWTSLSLIALLGRGIESWLWLGASVLTLAPSWMVEHRYTIVVLALWQILRRPLDATQEWLLSAWVAILGIASFQIMVGGRYLL